MKIQSFGCSFLSGSELSSVKRTWPSLISQTIGLEHENYARAGVGNLYILTKILNHADKDACVIVNWTYIDRFDFCSSQTERWETLRPSLDHDLADIYFKKMHGQFRDMLTALVYINTAIGYLKQQEIPFVMTYMDSVLFDTVDPDWHHPAGVDFLQNQIRPWIQDFGNYKNFLHWAEAHGYPISDLRHPLDAAHLAAADFWTETVQALIYNRANRS